jgi:bifunctional DNA-binding transcriptional regulator/antitoxin component of YhaV-PrlF toxin-antitoxin module
MDRSFSPLFGIFDQTIGKLSDATWELSTLTTNGSSTVSKTVEADDRGRIVIPSEIRERHGDRYRIVDLDDRVLLLPLQDDPIEGLRDAVGDTFDDISIPELREALDPAREDDSETTTPSKT